jgi:hypothetical protein
MKTNCPELDTIRVPKDNLWRLFTEHGGDMVEPDRDEFMHAWIYADQYDPYGVFMKVRRGLVSTLLGWCSNGDYGGRSALIQEVDSIVVSHYEKRD